MLHCFPFDTRIAQKEKEKISAYKHLKYEILRCWRNEVEKVNIFPIVIGTLGTVTKILKSYLEKSGIDVGTETVKKTGLLGTARILRRVLDIS